MAQKIIALLPLKANSERVPGKNFKIFAGKPLYRWILDSLLRVERIDQIVINTDARQLLNESGLKKSDRIVIRDRKPEICGDDVSMNLVIADDLEYTDADTYLMTHATNPLLRPETINSAIDQYFANSNSDSLFTVDKVQIRFYRQDASPVNHDPDNLIRTQDLEPWYAENSCLYIFSKESFAKTNARIGVSPQLFEVRALESVDIDENHHWIIAESLAQKFFSEING